MFPRLAAKCCIEMQMHIWLRGVHDTCHVSGDGEMVQGSRPWCGDQSEDASEPFTLLKSLLHKAHSHLELTYRHERIYWVDITTSAHGHAENAVQGCFRGYLSCSRTLWSTMAVAQVVQWSEVNMKGCGMIPGACSLRAEVSLSMNCEPQNSSWSCVFGTRMTLLSNCKITNSGKMTFLAPNLSKLVQPRNRK